METTNNETLGNTSLEEKLSALEQKYEQLTKSLESLQSDKVELRKTIDNMNNNFGNVNKNIEALLSKLNANEAKQASMHKMKDLMMGKNMDASFKGMMANPLRKLAVGTISTVFSATDMIVEASTRIREGLEDIVAEAQYEHKKKQMNMDQDKDPSFA